MNNDKKQNISPKEIASNYLNNGEMIKILTNAKRDNVLVPSELKNKHDLCLSLSRNFKEPLSLSDIGIRALLSFQGNKFNCFIPWDSIWCIQVPDMEYFFFENLFKEDIKFEVIEGEGFLTPPCTGHLKLVN